jgi:uncharacterized protein (DUF342 family)
MPKNNSDITRDVERIRSEEALTAEIKRLRDELYEADKKVVGLEVDNDRLVSEKEALAVINQQLQDEVEKLRQDNLQLIEQIGGGE